MDKERAKRTALSLHLLDAEGKRYVYGECAEQTLEKSYQYMDIGKRLLGYADDTMGTISDCYILYAIAILGVVDKQTIQMFLRNLKIHNPDLLIEDPSDELSFKARLRILKKYGFIFSISYEYIDASNPKSIAQYPNTLHTIDPEACNLINEKLSKRIPYNKWIQAKQLPELIGWSCAAFVGTNISYHKNFVAYLDGAFRNKYLGTFFFPCELKYANKDGLHYVAILDAYLYKNTKTHAEEDYQSFCVTKINAIRNYLTSRTSKGETHVVICVADKEDLEKMKDLIIRSDVLFEHLNNIYFTGEGILQNTSRLEDSFLQLYASPERKTDATFAASVPSFLL